MARACKFCHFLNSYICDDTEDCVSCGKCQQKEDPKK